MPQPDRPSLLALTAAAGIAPGRFVADAGGTVPIAAAVAGSSLDGPVELFRGKSVLISCQRQLPAVLALLALDGVAARVLLCPPDLDPVHVGAVVAEAAVDAIVSDGTGPGVPPPPGTGLALCHVQPHPADAVTDRSTPTQWLLFTSGTTGRPKLVVHSLQSLTGPLAEGPPPGTSVVWSTFYDVRRYGGLQILLRALLGGGSLVLSDAGEAPGDFLQRAGRCGVTHILGTPSHWRRALMSPAANWMAPRYVRLSGEVADQAILDSLAAAYPGAALTHAFASTEAGVGFEVTDGLAGFPAAFVGRAGPGAELRVVDGALQLRSTRTASAYLGARGVLAGEDGFVDTGDMVERLGDRYHFAGRREGVINVGGQKLHPEEVEAVINRHPGVRMSRVRGRPSPITGAIVVADVVVRVPGSFAAIRSGIVAACQAALPPHKVPAMLHEVASIEIAPSGKLVRPRA